jgi:ADP-dependent NAD(P)H-hydrate dehydratase / NAD(P)H-hydrate epimerase
LVLTKSKLKEVMLLPLPGTKNKAINFTALKVIYDFCRQADVLAIGPGLGGEASTQKLLRVLVPQIKIPIVIDADGLNAFSKKALLLPPNSVITPHPGEMARLLGLDIKKVQEDRAGLTRKLCCRLNNVVVLKGHHTLVADKKYLYINKTGNPGMSTAGCGDVLTGMIAAFIGQGLTLFEAAKNAVYLHGLAGDLASKEKTEISLIASDIIGKIPEAIKRSS